MISPSDEDSQTFSVNAANGEIYKLRGKYCAYFYDNMLTFWKYVDG